MLLYLALIDEEDQKPIFEELYLKYKNLTMQYALYLLDNNPQDAEDAFQLTWSQIARNLDHLRTNQERAIKHYILKTMKYKVLDVRKSNREWEKSVRSAKAQAKKARSGFCKENALLALCAKESQETIRRAIQALDAPYAEVLTFYYLFGLSVKEISAQFGIRESTVRTRLSRARALLKDELEKGGSTL